MLQTEKKLFVLYIILAILFILFTNKYYNFEETLMLRQNDGLSYMNIANYSFKFSQESLHYHHAQRFYIPYLIGLIGNTFNIDNYLIFQIFIYLSIIIIIIIHCKIVLDSNCDLKTAIIISSLVLLNPYLFRYFLSIPTMVNDAFFLLGLYIFCYGIFKKNFLIILGTIITLMSRQTGLFVFFCCILFLYQNKQYREILYVTILIVIIFNLSNFYAKNTSTIGFNFKHLWGIYFSIVEKDLIYTIKWLLLPLYGYLPILLYSIFRRKFFNLKISLEKILLILIFCSTIGISILAGPDMASRNIIRHTVIVLPVLSIFFLYYSSPSNNNVNFLVHEKILLILIIASSFHPTYSKIKIFESLKVITGI
tara:strand:- start:246 stop:1343 length:1098 start_codon:yes stop_codon:yes gene_type:complete